MPPPGHRYAWHTAKGSEVPVGTCLPAELPFSWDFQVQTAVSSQWPLCWVRVCPVIHRIELRLPPLA